MRLLPLALILPAALLVACGDSDSGAKSSSAPPANATSAASDLQVVQAGDLPGIVLNGTAFAVRTVEDQARVDQDPKEVADLKRDGFQEGRAVRFSVAGAGGYSTAVRFRDAAAARRELKSGITPADKGSTLSQGDVPELPGGRFADYKGSGFQCRNVYAITGAVLSFTGYCAKGKGDPGRGALVAAEKKVLARAS